MSIHLSVEGVHLLGRFSMKPIQNHRNILEHCTRKRRSAHQVVEILANLSDDSWESGTQELLHGRGPRGVPAIRLQIIDPL